MAFFTHWHFTPRVSTLFSSNYFMGIHIRYAHANEMHAVFNQVL
jgi:hypothetical protein